jgi:putative inorganic carbon (HCO3(-)) transporter
MGNRGNISTAPKISDRIEKFSEKTFLVQKLNNWPGYVLFALLALGMGYLMAHQLLLGMGITGMIVGLTVAIVCILNAEAGLYINMVYSFFICYFNRLLFNDELQVGVYSDLLIFITFLGFFVRRIRLRETINQFSKNPAVVALLLVYGLMAIELFNPSARFFVGWFPAFRKILGTLLVLFISFNVFNTREAIKRFIIVLFVICTLVAIYGCIQQWHGFFPFEMDWLRADPKRFRMTFLGGNSRKMSTMNDAVSFAIIMTTCSIFFMALAGTQKKVWQRLILIGGVILMLLGMSYTITRTANAMLVAGLVMFILLTFDKKTTRVLCLLAGLLFVTLLYAPVQNAQVDQFRQTFQASNDDSYKVRETNRESVQPYIYRHPIGGGLGTTGGEGLQYNPGHELAGFPPDSGSLKKALEIGWIGFGMICVLYFLVLRTGIRGYFTSRDPDNRLLYAACTAACFSFYVGDFAQVAIGQITDIVVYYPFIAILLQLKNFDKFDQPIKTPTA